MTSCFRGFTVGLALALASATTVLAHGDAVITLASTASGGGALTADYEFDSVSRVSFSLSGGGISFYTGIFPAFEPLATDNPTASLYVLADNTQVSIQITAIDDGKTSMKIDTATLSHVGDSTVLGTMPFPHTHPEYQLQLQLPEGTFGEGRLSFKLTASGPTTYTESPVYTVKISNGPLAPPDYDTGSYDKPNIKCYAAAAKAVAKFVAAEQLLLGKCLGKVQAYEAGLALASAPNNLSKLQAAAEKACADAGGTGPDSATMLGKIDAARTKATAAMQDACGSGGSGALSDDDISQELGLASCRAEELVAATYGTAHPELEEFPVRPSQSSGGATVTDHLPCLYLTASD